MMIVGYSLRMGGNHISNNEGIRQTKMGRLYLLLIGLQALQARDRGNREYYAARPGSSNSS